MKQLLLKLCLPSIEYKDYNKRVLLDGRSRKLTIGNNVDIAHDGYIGTLSHDPQGDLRATLGADVTFKDYVWITSRATLLPSVRIVGERKSNLLYQPSPQPWFR